MEARQPNDTLCYYIPGTALLNPTYDTPLSRFLAKVSKKLVSWQQPGLFTSGTDIEFIKFNDPRCPKSCHHFSPYFEYVSPDINNWAYVQWNGDLGQTAWKKTMEGIKAEIEKKMKERKNPNEPIDIHIVAHSNGGQIARLLAEAFKDNRDIRFHITSIEMPQSIIPPQLMPDNVQLYLQFFHKDDDMQRLGALIMQAEKILGEENLFSPVTFVAFLSLVEQWASKSYARRIEDVLVVENTYNGDLYNMGTKTLPPGHKSIEITMPIKDKHNDPINDPACARFICHEILKAVKEMEQYNRPQVGPNF